MALEPEDGGVEQKLVEALKRLNERAAQAPADTPAEAEMGTMIAPETMGVKSPSHHRPSAAALIKRSGRL